MSGIPPKCDQCRAPLDSLGRYLPPPQKDGYHNPSLAVDAAVVRVTERGHEILLIQRKYEPSKGLFAFPGGFVDYNEEPQHACIRELVEETNLAGCDPVLIGVYGNPTRDPRKHVVSVFYLLTVDDTSSLQAGDDAKHAEWFPFSELQKTENCV